ncbi:MAG: hypothetical protein WED81_00940, partial [Rhodothermales bacterium]
NRLFPAMTLGPGTIGGSITSDNISPMHLLNIKRLAFETNPVNPPTPVKQSERIANAGPPPKKSAEAPARGGRAVGEMRRKDQSSSGWIDKIEERLRARAGNAPVTRDAKPEVDKGGPAPPGRNGAGKGTALPLSDEKIDEIVRRFKK